MPDPTPIRTLALTPSSTAALKRQIPWATWLFLAAGWVLFALWWRVVLAEESTEFLMRALLVIAVGTAVMFAASIGWVEHNKLLSYQGRRGNGSPLLQRDWGVDVLGRPVSLPASAEMLTACVITVHTDAQGKRYVVEEQAVAVPVSGLHDWSARGRTEAT